MNQRSFTRLITGVGSVLLICACLMTHAQQPTDPAASTSVTGNSPGKPKKAGLDKEQILAKYRVSVEVARDRATLMHDIYESTLHKIGRAHV